MIAVLDYGIGNLRSAQKALVHLGADARLVSDPAGAAEADGVVLPGVGSFGACARALRQSGLHEVALGAARSAVPLLGLCVGFQLLFHGSEESPGAAGLGLLPGVLRRLPDGVKRPQMQWNETRPVRGRPSVLLGPLLEASHGATPPWFYYVHSYAIFAEGEPGEDCVATCDYGAPLVAAVERGMLFGTQFHPEKSGRAGLELLAAFVALCDSRRAERPAGPLAAPATEPAAGGAGATSATSSTGVG